MEPTMNATITVKGQTTIPKAIREHLGLKAGDRVKFFIHPDGTVVLLPTVPASALRGALKRPGQRPVSLEEMEAIASGSAERHLRNKRRR
jgi:AbrB family looped-hinge helix DNA binding protein